MTFLVSSLSVFACSCRVFTSPSGSPAGLHSSPLLQRVISPSSSTPSLTSSSPLVTKAKLNPLTRVMSLPGSPCPCSPSSPLTSSSALQDSASARTLGNVPRPSTVGDPGGATGLPTSPLSPGLCLSCAAPLYRRFPAVDRGVRSSQQRKSERKGPAASDEKAVQASKNCGADSLCSRKAAEEFQRHMLNADKTVKSSVHEEICQRTVGEGEVSPDPANRKASMMSAVTSGSKEDENFECHALGINQDVGFSPLPPTRGKHYGPEELNGAVHAKQKAGHSTVPHSSPSSSELKKTSFSPGVASPPSVQKAGKELSSYCVGQRDKAPPERASLQKRATRDRRTSNGSPLPGSAGPEGEKKGAGGSPRKEEDGREGFKIRESIWKAGGRVSGEYRKCMRTLLEKRINDANLISATVSTFTRESPSDEAAN